MSDADASASAALRSESPAEEEEQLQEDAEVAEVGADWRDTHHAIDAGKMDLSLSDWDQDYDYGHHRHHHPVAYQLHCHDEVREATSDHSYDY